MSEVNANHPSNVSMLSIQSLYSFLALQYKVLFFDDQFQLAMKSKKQVLSKMKILEKSYEQLGHTRTKVKATSNYANQQQHTKTKKWDKSFHEEWLIPFQTIRNQIIRGCSLDELEYAWKSGNIEKINDGDTYLQKDSIFWEEQEDLLILHFYFSPDEFSFQMKNLLSIKSSKTVLQRYNFLNIQDINRQIHRIEAIVNQLKKLQEGEKAIE